MTCNQEVKLDVFLRIRHRLTFIFRNIVCKFAQTKIPNSIIGRLVLKSLGYESSERLMDARDKYDGDIDIKEWLYDDGNEEITSGNIAALFGEWFSITGVWLRMMDCKMGMYMST